MTNIKDFKDLLRMKQADLHNYLCEVVPSYYEEDKIIDQYGSFLYCEGNIPVLMVAHLDTVHKTPPTQIFYDKEQGIMWSPQGIGGDDRCGVWSILEILDKGFLPSIVFTWNEEIGALGANDFCTLFDKKDLQHINLAIEIDRRGTMDCVFYDLDYTEFEDFIEEFNFKTAWGSFSDISTICPHFGFAGVNLSAGYFNEHTSSEYIDVPGMEYTIERTCEILKSEGISDRWKWKENPRYNNYGYGCGNKSVAYGWGEDDITYEDWGHLLKGKDKDKTAILDWCASCQNLVEPSVGMAPSPYDDMCIHCYKKLNVTEEHCQVCGNLKPMSDMADCKEHIICNDCMDNVETYRSEQSTFCEECNMEVDDTNMYAWGGKIYCRECLEKLA